MAQSQTAVPLLHSGRNGRATPDKASDLTFITSEGEVITFPEMEMPLGDATVLASEEALGKIWDRPAEDAAWRDM